MARTTRDTAKVWIVEALKDLGGCVEFDELVRHLEKTKERELTAEDYLPQKGHPKDTQFKYICRWAVTALRGDGVLKRGSPRGWVEFETRLDTDKYLADSRKKVSAQRKTKKANSIHSAFVGSKPNEWIITLSGDRIRLATWRELLIAVARWIGAEQLKPLLNRKRGKWPIIVDDGGPAPKKYAKVPNTPYQVYVWANADLIVRLAHYLLSESGNDPDILQLRPIDSQDDIPKGITKRRTVIRRKSRLTTVERHRLLLEHLSRYGELTQSEQERLALTPEDVMAWLDALLVARPPALVVSPLFLWAAEGDPDPVRFTTRLAIRMTGDYLDRALSKPIASLEEYTWEHFGHWHLPQPHPGEVKWHGYLSVPATEPADRSASEKLDLFAHLPSDIISELVRDTSFLSVQQEWSAKAATKGDLGPLSRQMKLGIRRPLFLSQFEISVGETDGIGLKDLPESEALIRSHVVAGLSLGTFDEWRQNLRLSRDDTAERLLGHPLYAAIVQFEVQRMTASLSGEIAASLQWDNSGNCRLMINGNSNTPLWLACRTLLEDLGFWPATTSLNDAAWDAAVRCALSNLEILGVLEQAGDGLRLSDHFASKIKAHPGHPQNRGEKSYRVKLVQYLKKTSGGTP